MTSSWIKKHIFLDQEGREKKLWEIGRGKRYLAHQLIRESSSGLKLTCDLCWTPLRHPKSSQQLYLVKARVKGHVCYLITNEPVQHEAQAWEIFFAYKRRWQIETSFRYGKCELALESPRLWSFDKRLKLLGIVLLVYAFLLSLLEEVHAERLQALLRLKCHRTLQLHFLESSRKQGYPCPLFQQASRYFRCACSAAAACSSTAMVKS